MYSRFQLLKKYLGYYMNASNGMGHGVHSPFVFDFIKQVLNDKKEYSPFKRIESVRKELLQDPAFIEVKDFGAGSGIIKTKKRQVKKIAASSLKPKKYAQLLYRMVKYYKPVNVVELGTSFGITTSYLAAGGDTPVYTMEGGSTIATIASKTFSKLGIINVELINGPFETNLPSLLSRISSPGFVFIDGYHRKEPTVDYFRQIVARCTPMAILVFDDIHWSREMEEAWEEIKTDPAVTLTIDLFFLGIVMFRKEFKVKQHFIIRF